jgi:hypothetical protein
MNPCYLSGAHVGGKMTGSSACLFSFDVTLIYKSPGQTKQSPKMKLAKIIYGQIDPAW